MSTSDDTATETLRRTSLYDAHVAAGAKIVAFAGWEMPVVYPDGIRAEHLTVRSSSGVFDVSHMGQIETTGPQATEFLQRLVSNDVTKVEIGGAQYSTLCREDGGVIDDLFTYRLAGERYLTVTNASNHQTDFEWFAQNSGDYDVDLADRANEYAMLAVQGPRARADLAGLIEGEAPPRMTAVEAKVAGRPALVCGTGYTGEDGVELLVAPDDAPAIWESLLAAGVAPIGLAARDTLRLEVCFHLYGNDLSLERNPIEAGLAWACALGTGFIGADALRAVKMAGPAQKLVAFLFTGPGIPRQGNTVVKDGAEIGVVTSGTLSPSLGTGAGMAYVDATFAEPGTTFDVDVRGRLRPATVHRKPLYKRGSPPAA
ncbi:MAG: glycine cleavage system aminomethyltransferase GcvT [Solirubrobacterales bacterium]